MDEQEKLEIERRVLLTLCSALRRAMPHLAEIGQGYRTTSAILKEFEDAALQLKRTDER